MVIRQRKIFSARWQKIKYAKVFASKWLQYSPSGANQTCSLMLDVQKVYCVCEVILSKPIFRQFANTWKEKSLASNWLGWFSIHLFNENGNRIT